MAHLCGRSRAGTQPARGKEFSTPAERARRLGRLTVRPGRLPLGNANIAVITKAPPSKASACSPQLFSPLQIGPVRLKNRVVSTGHDTMMAAGGTVTDRLVAYHAARAAGGAGRD
jgi:hypothetical protein